MENEYYDRIDGWVQRIISTPRNLATEVELIEQSKVALKLFLRADIDNSKFLSFEELKNLCDHMGLPMTDNEEEGLIKLDTDGNGTLDVEEFVNWWLERISTLPNPLKQQEAIAKNTFNKFDTDISGTIDINELHNLLSELGAELSEEELMQAINEIDEDNSGLIDSSEFVAWWTNRAANNRRNVSLISLKLRKLANKASQVFYTDIFTAAWNGNLSLIKSFIESEKRLAKASDTSEHGNGWSSLHYASYQGHLAIVSILIDNGADVNNLNDFGFTPLIYAAQQGHIDICEYLLEHRADPTIFGKHSDYPDIFLCPVDFIIDYPKLKSIFSKNEKCQVSPPNIIADRLSGIITVPSSANSKRIASVTIDMDPFKSSSMLPIKTWELTLIFSEFDEIVLSNSAKIPLEIKIQGQSYDKISQKIDFLISDEEWNKTVASNDANVNEIMFSLVGINSIGLRSNGSSQKLILIRKVKLKLPTVSAIQNNADDIIENKNEEKRGDQADVHEPNNQRKLSRGSNSNVNRDEELKQINSEANNKRSASANTANRRKQSNPSTETNPNTLNNKDNLLETKKTSTRPSSASFNRQNRK
eukprot:gene9672-13022_t